MTNQTNASFAAERSIIYWLLSRFYLEQPDRPFIVELQEWLASHLTGEELEPVKEFSDLSLALLGLQSDDDYLDLQKEHTRLFAGLSKTAALPPPYECVFRQGRLAGDITVDVNHHYAQSGYGEIFPQAGPQDHLGVELRFMSLLCYDEHSSGGEPGKAQMLRDRQREFLDRHLLQWAPDYCASLQQETSVDYYSSIAALTVYSLRTDSGMLARLMAA